MKKHVDIVIAKWYYVPSLTVDEPMSARIPRDNGISGTFLIVLKTLYAGATSKVF